MKIEQDNETAEDLLAFVRGCARDDSGSTDWVPFALQHLLQEERAAERAECQAEAETALARPTAGHARLPEPDAILTPEQVASIFTIPKKTVIALCAANRLEGAFKAGRRWRIPGRAVRTMAGTR